MLPPSPRIRRVLGTMVAYGFERGPVSVDLDIAARLGATCLEVLPDWARFPDPREMASAASDRGLAIHSAHGCWGGQSIRAPRVDLGSIDPATWRASLDDLKRCLDWLRDAGGTCLVVHPGGLSDPQDAPARRDALVAGLAALADHAEGSGLVVCVENMPPGVHPGSRMSDLAGIVALINRPEVGLAIDTGHANMVDSADVETHNAGAWLRTTHVHDNKGQDVHDPPGTGTVHWGAWIDALDSIAYTGPIMLECIRHLRKNPESINPALANLLARLTGGTLDE